MCRKISFGLMAILALAACGAAEDNTGSDTVGKGDNATAAVSSAEPDVIESGETESAVIDEKTVSDETEKSRSTDKKDSGDKIADCKITSIPGDTEYQDDCAFLPHGGGSFTVKRSNGQSFVDGITAFILELDTKTAAGLSVRDANGDLTYLGVAEKSGVDGACWESENYSVCVYAK